METSEQKKWADLALRTKDENTPEGYVFVGRGHASDWLEIIFGNIPCRKRVRGRWETGLAALGSLSEADYAVRVGTWERATGLKFLETKETKSMNIYTKKLPGLIDTALHILKEKGHDWKKDDTDYTHLLFTGTSLWSGNGGSTDFTEVSAAEFITAIQSVPEQKKTVSVKISGVNAVITEKNVSVGCQLYTKEEILGLKATIEESRKKKINLPEKEEITISFGPPTISCGGYVFSEADLNKVITEF